MKKLCSLLLVLMSLCVLPIKASELYPLVGNYKFNGQFEILQAFQIRVVRLYRDIDREELRQLKSDGFTCSYVDSKTARCKRFENVRALPQSVKNRLLATYQNSEIDFAPLRAAPDVLFKGDSYTEYLMPGQVDFMGQSWQEYRYFESDQLHKAQTGQEIPSKYSFIIDSESKLRLVFTSSKTLSNGFYSYLLALPFLK